jgi:DNA-binding NarL/FixJ family response regulator
MAADVAVVEMDPEEIDDPEEVSSLASLGSAIVILVDRDTPVLTPGAVRSGVRAVLPKRVRPEELLAAVQAAAADLVVLPVQDFVSPAGWSPPPGRSEALIEPLTAREMEVLAKMSEGLSNKEISSSLAISEHTVKFHVASILSKLEATSRTEAVMQAIRKGLIMV